MEARKGSRSASGREKEEFLDEFAVCGSARLASERLGIPRNTHYGWLRTDPDYAEQFIRLHEEVLGRPPRVVNAWDYRPTEVLKEQFLEAFRACGSAREAARTVGIHRNTHYAWLKQDPRYAQKFAQLHRRWGRSPRWPERGRDSG